MKRLTCCCVDDIWVSCFSIIILPYCYYCSLYDTS